MTKPKRIQRHGPNGPQELTNIASLTPPASHQELIMACLELGQDMDIATDTVSMYEENILDPADVVLLEETVIEKRKGDFLPQTTRAQPSMVESKKVVRSEGKKGQFFVEDVESIAKSIHSANINPRNPNSSKQKMTQRDSAGRIVGLYDVQ